MKKPQIDKERLLFAWQDSSPDNKYYLDIRTGDIELVNPDLLDLRDLTDEIEQNRYRYLYIPKPDMHQELDDMRDFIAQLADKQLQAILAMAMESPNKVWSCRQVLGKNGDQLNAWETFQSGRIHIRINQWLEANFSDKEDDADAELDADDWDL